MKSVTLRSLHVVFSDAPGGQITVPLELADDEKVLSIDGYGPLSEGRSQATVIILKETDE